MAVCHELANEECNTDFSHYRGAAQKPSAKQAMMEVMRAGRIAERPDAAGAQCVFIHPHRVQFPDGCVPI